MAKTYLDTKKEEKWNANTAIRRARNEKNGDYGGGYTAPTAVSYNVQTPAGTEWWKPLAYQGGGQNEILAASANALIPSYSGDEQANITKWLATNFTDFNSYGEVKAPTSVQDISGTRKAMFSRDRAKKAIDSLDAMRIASGATEDQMGAGYAFLKKSASLLDKYSIEGGGISKANFAAMQAEFENMLGGIDSSYQQLGRSLLNPSVGGNPLMQAKNAYRVPNTKLFE
jgi:hypothetical protein